MVAYSVSPSGKEIITYELEYPRFIHGEFMTHRNFSRNAMSSRAVPIEKMIEQVRTNPAVPIHWGKNQSGMQAKVELEGSDLGSTICEWEAAARLAASCAEKMDEYGAHKQVVNRILEPFQVMKTVMTTTEINNFFYLRCHEDAQPEIKELADCMYEAYNSCEAELLKNGEWHTPYVDHFRASDGDAVLEYHSNSIGLSVEDALKVSASCCAQVSFRVYDDGIDKAKRIYDRLVESKPVHASPFEHQAKPISSEITGAYGCDLDAYDIEEGVTHFDFDKLWSGNFCGWIQYRQLIKDNVCNKYQPE